MKYLVEIKMSNGMVHSYESNSRNARKHLMTYDGYFPALECVIKIQRKEDLDVISCAGYMHGVIVHGASK